MGKNAIIGVLVLFYIYCNLYIIFLTFIRLSGFPPFFDEENDNLRLFEKIKKGKYDFPSPTWDFIS